LEELKAAGLVEGLKNGLGPKNLALLEKLAPVRVTLKGGRTVSIHYEEGKPPWVQSKLQDFFGMRKGPLVGDGQIPVVLHLLSPAQRAVQVTSDLAGFWEKHYPQIRKELMRKYPRQKWPENPV
jgi:ATP-dependent helicase HrpB